MIVLMDYELCTWTYVYRIKNIYALEKSVHAKYDI